jgi:anti-sigma B factor antagonist
MPGNPDQQRADSQIPDRFELRRFRNRAAQTIGLVGELDVGTSGELALAIEVAGATGAGIIVLDLSQLEFIDSSGIHVIVEASARLPTRLVIVKGPPCVHRVFELCGLVEHLAFAETPAHRESPAHANGNPSGQASVHPALLAQPMPRGAGRSRRAGQALLATAIRDLRSASDDSIDR